MDYFKGKNVLITGINGFIGTAAARSFLLDGAHVVGIVKDTNRKTDADVLEECSIVRGDIRDYDTVRYTISHYEIDFVLHLASQPIVKVCHSDPYTAYETNVMGVVNVLEACRVQKIPPRKIVVLTSDKYYGSAKTLPYTEDLPPEVADTYCTSKTCQDMVARSFAQTYHMPVVVSRAGNVYGPGDFNMSRLIPKNAVKLYSGESPVLYSHAAEMVREFLYIDDVVAAFKIMLKKGLPGEAYNVGGSEPVKIGHLVDVLRNKINKYIEIKIEEVPFGEISKQYLNADRLKDLGWENRVSLEVGLEKTVEFYKYCVDSGKIIL